MSVSDDRGLSRRVAHQITAIGFRHCGVVHGGGEQMAEVLQGCRRRPIQPPGENREFVLNLIITYSSGIVQQTVADPFSLCSTGIFRYSATALKFLYQMLKRVAAKFGVFSSGHDGTSFKQEAVAAVAAQMRPKFLEFFEQWESLVA